MSSSVPVICPACATRQDAASDRIGREIRCSKCAAPFLAKAETQPDTVRSEEDEYYANLAQSLDPAVATAAPAQSLPITIRPSESEEAQVRGMGVVVAIIACFLTLMVVGIAGLGFIAYTLWPKSQPREEVPAVADAKGNQPPKKPIEVQPPPKAAETPKGQAKPEVVPPASKWAETPPDPFPELDPKLETRPKPKLNIPLVPPDFFKPKQPVVEVPPVVASSFVRLPEKPFAIAPTKAADQTELKLPGSVDAVCLAGGGRFVLYRIPKVRQIAVLDVTEGKIKYLPLVEEGAYVAGGMSHLFVLAPTANAIQRWSLTTFEKEATVPNPFSATPRGLLMGHASDGPLFVASPNAFLDAQTFKEVKLGGPMNIRGMGSMAGHPSHPPSIRVSADGHVYAWFTRGLSPSGLCSLSIEGTTGKSHYEHTTVGEILPGPDGTLFTGGGIFTPELKPLGGKKGYQYWYHAPIPAAHGPFYLSIPQSELPRSRGTPGRLTLNMLGEDRALAEFGELAGLDIPKDNNQTMATGLQLHDRVALVPDAKAMVVLNGSCTAVVIHRFDLDALLTKSNVDFLFATSKPQAAVRGSTFTYKPTVHSKRGGVKLKIEAGPDGMKVAGDKVEWAVPAGFVEEAVTVILTISDAGAGESLHTFKLPVKDK